jgi:hypothetical protein
MSLPKSLAISLLLMLPGAAFANWSCQSDEQQVALLELYTSQGCSSCPPADRWLSATANRDELWTRIVPVAWHVTYWDYIGWRDPFGRRDNDLRQRRMAAAAGAGVYTPGMFLNRAEYARWRRSPPGSASGESRKVGRLSAEGGADGVTIRFQPAPSIQLRAPQVELVFLSSGEHTAVSAGENRGRELRNDFVAGELNRTAMEREGRGWVARLQAAPAADSEAVALWVIDDDGNYLQATGAWLETASR